MPIRDLFQHDVTRDIPPVVYFHDQDPERLASEVSEYIITGGYPAGHPHHQRVPDGIHEQYVRLLTAVARALEKPAGPELPASWISGFYGSGKSSFAKLLGLALDGTTLPDGSSLADRWLACDTSPEAPALRAAWTRLRGRLEPVACVFDIGGVARDNEHIHSAAVRQVQRRLGYSRDALVARFELRLERDGRWPAFESAAADALGGPWSARKDEPFADEHFSTVLHAMDPDRYTDPLSWVDAHGGGTEQALSVDEATQAISDMLAHRAPDATLFLVVDEVSQYIHQDAQRMLKLQSFVSSLGQRLGGRVWLLVTGQEKLEEESEATVLGKMKDRFPPSLRVHLAPTNIRDVVHKRLLRKRTDARPALRELWSRHEKALHLYAWPPEEAVTEEDFVEVYPMLPGHIDLLLAITSALRTRSSHVQGDDHAIRGLLQLLGELFRARRLADEDVGALVTLDAIFDVQRTALDADVQTTLARIFERCADQDDPLAARAARAVALLELIQDQVPTTAAAVAAALYDRVDRGDQRRAVGEALERLRLQNLLGFSEKHGYKIQSSAAQEWERERREIGVTEDHRSDLVSEQLGDLLGDIPRPTLRGTRLHWSATYTDGRRHDRTKLLTGREPVAALDFRKLRREDSSHERWIKASDRDDLRERIVWIAGDASHLRDAASELRKSLGMVARYRPTIETLSHERKRLLIEEEARAETLQRTFRDAVTDTFLRGRLYFRGRELPVAGSIAATLERAAADTLGELYPSFDPTTVTDKDLAPLLQPEIVGPSAIFLDGGLGLLERDGHRYQATCQGRMPHAVHQYVQTCDGTAGAILFDHFAGPPYGWHESAVRACLVGLLRAGRVRLRFKGATEDTTSIRDPGVSQAFSGTQRLRQADVLLARVGPITPRKRVALCQLFQSRFDVSVARENDAIADAAFKHLTPASEQLRDVERLLNKLPGAPPTPPALQKLGKALEDCRRRREIEATVVALDRHRAALDSGLQLLHLYRAELTAAALASVRAAADVRDHQAAQLGAAGALDGPLAAAALRLDDHLASERPWQGIASLDADLAALRDAYAVTRRRLMADHQLAAEAARTGIKTRPGFQTLSDDRRHHVLRPITEAVPDTSPDAVAPSLSELHDAFTRALGDAVEEANVRLDEALGPHVARLKHGLTNRVITDEASLEAALDSLGERVRKQLAAGHHVRLV